MSQITASLPDELVTQLDEARRICTVPAPK